MLPAFQFVKLYGDIVRVTCYHLLSEKFLWVPGREFEWDDLFIEKEGLTATQDRFRVPSMV
jgi:hypothetical protein